MGGLNTLRIGILALQGDFAAHAEAVAAAAPRAHLKAETVLVRTPAHLHGLDGLILPGGESTTFLKFLARDGLLGELRSFVESRPTFGTCAGAILLARKVLNPPQASLAVLDATIERNGYGRQLDSAIHLTESTLPGGPLEAVYIRAPRFRSVGVDVQVLAEREGFPVLVQQGHLLAATFHPELSGDPRVHAHFLSMAADRSQVGS